jgi:hypothetical protein
MLTAENIKSMKQTNVSVNGDLTIKRVKELFKAASKEHKLAIESLATVKRVSIQRVYSTGNISAKIAVAIAQTLNTNPFYLTGETDKRGACTNDTLGEFLNAKGYKGLAGLVDKPPRKKRDSQKSATAAKSAELTVPTGPASQDSPCQAEPCCDSNARKPAEMTEEEAVQLLRSLYLQSQFSCESKVTLEQIQTLLA